MRPYSKGKGLIILAKATTVTMDVVVAMAAWQAIVPQQD
ncbi:hypothetical protein X566_00565 [Afipia sp. P52-10]|nr:hypothetical protein X566_00565 [Afipia sp. P52-10]